MPDTAVADFKPLSRVEMAARVARDIPEGWYVNLGIGIPTAIADHVPLEREVIFHSENGVLGMGPAPAKDAIDPWLINAGKQYVTLRQGGSFCHHADSFSMTAASFGSFMRNRKALARGRVRFLKSVGSVSRTLAPRATS
jgi:3-oxoadipate CoA-transferase beta subunit